MKKILKLGLYSCLIFSFMSSNFNVDDFFYNYNSIKSRNIVNINNTQSSNLNYTYVEDSISILNYDISSDYNLEIKESTIKSNSKQNIKIKYLNCNKGTDDLSLYSNDEIAFISYHFEKEVSEISCTLTLKFENTDDIYSHYPFYNFCIEQKNDIGWNSLACYSNTIYSGELELKLSLTTKSLTNDIRISLIHDSDILEKITLKIKDFQYTYLNIDNV